MTVLVINHIVDLCRKFSQDDLTGQVNHKFQYSMTKTFTTVVLHRFAKPGLSVIIQLGTTVDGLFF